MSHNICIFANFNTYPLVITLNAEQYLEIMLKNDILTDLKRIAYFSIAVKNSKLPLCQLEKNVLDHLQTEDNLREIYEEGLKMFSDVDVIYADCCSLSGSISFIRVDDIMI